MDLIFIGLAVACLLLSGPRRCLLLWMIPAEFIVSALWIKLSIPDPWWFLAYATQSCAFVVAVMLCRHRLSYEYAGTLIAAALLSVGIFIETYAGGSWLWGAHTVVMSVICSYQLWLAAVSAGMAEGTLTEAVCGLFARGSGRIRRPRFDSPPGNMGGKV